MGWTKGLSLSRSSTLSDDIQDLAATSDPPTLSQLYGEAAEFEKVLASSGCIDCRCSHKDGSNGFADLIGCDLDRYEQAVADRVNKFSVARYYENHPFDLSESNNKQDVLEDIQDSVPIINRVVTDSKEEEPWQLDPPEIISLLIDEFGPLTTEGEEERLLLETDGCLILDVFIMGVIHVTTHRVAFHASLLESKPNLPLSQRAIKTGPAVLHRKGWRAKRRIWLELSYDMLCAYTSSSDEVAFIKKVQPINPQHPRYLRIELNVRSRDLVDAFEFDTEESARDWCAIFLYRHQRQVALDTSIPEEETGIRLSLPLNRIAKVRFGCYPEFPCIASLLVQSLPLETVEDEDAAIEQETIHIGTVRPTYSWNHLEKRVEAARHRLLKRPLDQFPVFIDFGPLTFHESQSMPHDTDIPWIKEVAIREALALGFDETHMWVITVKNKLPLKLVFKNSYSRDDAQEKAMDALERARFPPMSPTSSTLSRTATMTSATSASSMTPESTLFSPTNSSETPKSASFSATSVLSPISRTVKAVQAAGFPPHVHLRLPKAINLPREMLPRMPSMHFVCLTIGSRGDVQPYISLGLGLMKEGHRVTIVTHEEYREWIMSFNIGHRTAGGDPGALMKLSVENKVCMAFLFDEPIETVVQMFSPEFFKESLTKVRSFQFLRAWILNLVV
ncbi:hypothetical protein C0993_001882 [Termitomyces sp. T159_Od127]|nr:hypothetical protein C0993_001882 [Termitomyces sp. T159_Od127]